MKLNRLIALAALSCLGAVALANTTVTPQKSAQTLEVAPAKLQLQSNQVFGVASVVDTQLPDGVNAQQKMAVQSLDAKKVVFTGAVTFKPDNVMQQTAAVGAKADYDIPILKFGLARAASPGVNEYRVAKIRLGVSEMMVGMAGKTKYGLGVQTVAKPGGSYIANGTYVARVTPQSGTLFALSAAPKVTNAA